MFFPPSKRQSNIMIMETILEEIETRPWSDLPRELLSPIADRLGIIELLSFRGTCKDWQSASSTASARIESSPNHNPWFLLVAEGNTQCQLYNVDEKRKYSITIPDLEESTCLASNQGWLLLFNKGSICFFCPLSQAKIELPNFPHLELLDHVATISAPPTSSNCIVCVINRKDELKMELNFLKRGDEKWDNVDHDCPRNSLDTIMGATFDGGSFYFLDKDNKLLTYSLKKKTWAMYRIVESRTSTTIDYLPFMYKNSYFKNNGEFKSWLKLGEDVSISTCGTVVEGYDLDTVINNESIEASSKESQSRKVKGIWIQPRFFQISPNQSWCL